MLCMLAKYINASVKFILICYIINQYRQVYIWVFTIYVYRKLKRERRFARKQQICFFEFNLREEDYG